ncbi:hypothetical protein MS5380_18750 [Klebsiella pneumoniae]|nr:hypothetical protein Kpn21f22_29980 [Klebsiella pneumoniae]BDT00312.1 hypothetical protein Kpn21rf22_29800 [Klebsiella pneumoniae]GKM86248.1 hypothetical protein MS5232_13450 [Klebsiella pneumoniae]GKN09280.1 hypothetical protein MS5380_18750 [Klebsiella pneumoniae]
MVVSSPKIEKPLAIERNIGVSDIATTGLYICLITTRQTANNITPEKNMIT